MIRSIEFTVSGMYTSVILTRDKGEPIAEMACLDSHGGMALTKFDFADLKKAVETLEQADGE